MIFISFDSQDRNMVALAVGVLRQFNPSETFFWTADSIEPGSGWFAAIEKALRECSGVVSFITNNSTGTNPWIVFEAGAAIGAPGKRLLMICASGISIPLELSRPIQELQLVGWSNRTALTSALEQLKLCSNTEAVEALVSALTPFKITAIRYGSSARAHIFTSAQRMAFADELENRKHIQIGNHLIGNFDPDEGVEKTIQIDLERCSRRYTMKFPERAVVRRSDLYQ